MSWIVTLAAGIAAGAAGAMGLGGGSLLLLYLTLFAGVEQMEAQGINLIVFLPTAAVGLLLHSRSGLVDWKAALACAAFGLAGVAAGLTLADIAGTELLGRIFGGFLLFIGAREIFARKPDEA